MSRTRRQRNADAQERLKQEHDRLRRELAERERQLAQHVERAFFASGERYVNASAVDVSNLARAPGARS